MRRVEMVFIFSLSLSLNTVLHSQECDTFPDLVELQPYAAAGWNQLGTEKVGIGNDGEVRIVIDSLSGNNNVVLGLSSDPDNSSGYQDMEFALYIMHMANSTSRIQIYENGTYIDIIKNKPEYGGLVLGIRRTDEVIEYLVNDVVSFTSKKGSTDSLFFDSSALKKDSLSIFSASDINICELEPQEAKPLECKELPEVDYQQPYPQIGWNQFDIGMDDGLAADGELTFELGDYTDVNNFCIGLDANPRVGLKYTEIDYSVFVRTGIQNIISIYENGVFKKHLINSPESVLGTRIKIKRKDGVVTYYVDDVVFFTSDTLSSEHLYYDNAATRRNNSSSIKFVNLALCAVSDN